MWPEMSPTCGPVSEDVLVAKPFDPEAYVASKEAEARATEQAVHERRFARVQGSATEWRALARVYMREAEEAQIRLDSLLALKQSTIQVSAIPVPTAHKGDKHSQSTACLLASDWHIDERVRPGDIPGGRNRYSPDIADQRIENFWRNSVKLIDSFRAETTIRNLVLFALGDFFSGWIHEELRHVTEMSPIQAVEWLQPRFVAGLDYLAKHGGFDRIDVVTMHGNHSRISVKEYSVPALASLEHLLYLWLASHYKDNPLFKFHITTATREILTIGGVHVRYSHGNSWKYRGGVGGVLVPMMALTNRWNLSERADHDVYGHWHQYTPAPRATGNGSLIGYTPYGARFGPYEIPQQGLFLVSHKYRRVTLQVPVFVE